MPPAVSPPPTPPRGGRAVKPPPPGGIEGGPEGVYPWGESWQPDHCNNKASGLETTSPVGLFPAGANAAGLHDMAGNVYEWCQDWYGEDYYAHSQDARNPTGPEKGDFRVLRGGSWADEHPFCRCGYRDRTLFVPLHWDNINGFRCARTLSS